MPTAEERKKLVEATREENRLLEQQKTLGLALGNMEQARAAQAQINANNQELIKKYKENIKDLSDEELKTLKEIENTEKENIKQLEKEREIRQKVLNVISFANNQLKIGWQYLMQSDKAIRQTILSLGMSGVKAELMRTSFEQSAGFVTRLGGDLTDIQNIMTGYADETGRARVLSADMVKDIEAIGKGTGLGVEQATRLGAQFELMGFDAKTTMDYVQGVVDTSERMGVNTTKVLKNVNDNFKRLNTYTFQQGVKGFAQMAEYAEKFRIDINQALNAADVAKSLEGAIGLAAKLQVMGGEFAKTDPFQMLFLARNDPAKFTEKIADMTKGVVTFRKMSDGTFEKFISPVDRDRLAAVAKSLGMEAGELTKIAERQAEIQRMRQQMAGMGLSAKEKEVIEGAAIFNKTTGRFEVQLAGEMRDVSRLTKDQADSFLKEHKSLADRAKEAQTFDEAFKATINSLKSALLPLLQGVNKVLTAAKPMLDSLGKIAGKKGGVLEAAGILLLAGGVWKGVAFTLTKAASNWVRTGSIFAKEGKEIGGLRRFISGGGVATAEKTATETGGGLLGRVGGKGMAGAGAGVGMAAVGIGAGIGAAAAGISLLANAMSKLTPDQAETLKSIVKSLGWFILGGVGVAVAIAAIGAAGGAVAVPLMAFGGAVALIGAGIGLATAGIGIMATGLAKLVTAGKDAGPSMRSLSGGIAELSVAMMSMTFGFGGMVSFSMLMNKIAKHAPALAIVGDSFKQISAVMSGSKDDFVAVQNAVESISKMKIKSGGIFSDLVSLLKNPLKVEFADKQVSLVDNITLDIDSQKFMQKIYKPHLADIRHEEIRTGKVGT